MLTLTLRPDHGARIEACGHTLEVDYHPPIAGHALLSVYDPTTGVTVFMPAIRMQNCLVMLGGEHVIIRPVQIGESRAMVCFEARRNVEIHRTRPPQRRTA